jgi:hypothetical protein
VRVEAVLQLSGGPTQKEGDQAKWTAAIVTAALTGDSDFFLRQQFQQMLDGFRRVIADVEDWSQVGPLPVQEKSVAET